MATFPRRQKPISTGRKAYQSYRPQVQSDFKHRCAHCGVHEDDWPHGESNYHIDHFMPKGNPRIKVAIEQGLIDIDDYFNLYWCCSRCNGRSAKGSNWPSEEDEQAGIGFVDLCHDDWHKHYKIHGDGTLEDLTIKAKYTIETIGLNDDGYKKIRREVLSRGGFIYSP